MLYKKQHHWSSSLYSWHFFISSKSRRFVSFCSFIFPAHSLSFLSILCSLWLLEFASRVFKHSLVWVRRSCVRQSWLSMRPLVMIRPSFFSLHSVACLDSTVSLWQSSTSSCLNSSKTSSPASTHYLTSAYLVVLQQTHRQLLLAFHVLIKVGTSSSCRYASRSGYSRRARASSSSDSCTFTLSACSLEGYCSRSSSSSSLSSCFSVSPLLCAFSLFSGDFEICFGCFLASQMAILIAAWCSLSPREVDFIRSHQLSLNGMSLLALSGNSCVTLKYLTLHLPPSMLRMRPGQSLFWNSPTIMSPTCMTSLQLYAQIDQSSPQVTTKYMYRYKQTTRKQPKHHIYQYLHSWLTAHTRECRLYRACKRVLGRIYSGCEGGSSTQGGGFARASLVLVRLGLFYYRLLLLSYSPKYFFFLSKRLLALCLTWV